MDPQRAGRLEERLVWLVWLVWTGVSQMRRVKHLALFEGLVVMGIDGL